MRNGNRARSRSRRCRSVESRCEEGAFADSEVAVEGEGEVRGFFSRRRLASAGNVEEADSPSTSIVVDQEESRFEVSERCRSFRRQISGEDGGEERLSNRLEARMSVERLCVVRFSQGQPHKRIVSERTTHLGNLLNSRIVSVQSLNSFASRLRVSTFGRIGTSHAAIVNNPDNGSSIFKRLKPNCNSTRLGNDGDIRTTYRRSISP